MYTISGLVEVDHIHVRTNKKQSSTIRFIDIFTASWVWYAIGFKPTPLISNKDLNFIIAYGIVNFNLFGGVHFIAVPDGVDKGLLDGKVDGKDIFLAKIAGFEFGQKLLTHTGNSGGLTFENHRVTIWCLWRHLSTIDYPFTIDYLLVRAGVKNAA